MAGVVFLRQGAVAQALSAPVQRDHGITPPEQFADDLGGVLLDEFAAALSAATTVPRVAVPEAFQQA